MPKCLNKNLTSAVGWCAGVCLSNVQLIWRNKVTAEHVSTHQDLVGLGLTDAFDVEKLFFWSVGHCFDGVEACVLQLLDVTGTDATLLIGDPFVFNIKTFPNLC